jgi:hypothetical protein
VAKERKTEEQEALKNGPLNIEDVPSAKAEDRELDPAQQARALAHYRVSGQNSLGYVDQSRDQEPDIGAEFGQAPHPELFNPEPHSDATLLGSSQGGPPGIGQVSDSQLVSPSEETVAAREEEVQRQVEARQNVVVGGTAVAPGPAQPVVIVDPEKDAQEAREAQEQAAKDAEKAAKADAKKSDSK